MILSLLSLYVSPPPIVANDYYEITFLYLCYVPQYLSFSMRSESYQREASD
jgi:hypothetical protein